jgi:fluoride exporter
VTTRRRAWIVVAVALGGALGTVARYELALAAPVSSGHFPWATFLANVAGSLVLGVAVVAVPEVRPSSSVARALVAVGFCGGLTTFSTLMVENVLLTRDGAVGVAALYLVISLLAGFAAVALGVGAARLVLRRPAPAFDAERDD